MDSQMIETYATLSYRKDRGLEFQQGLWGRGGGDRFGKGREEIMVEFTLLCR